MDNKEFENMNESKRSYETGLEEIFSQSGTQQNMQPEQTSVQPQQPQGPQPQEKPAESDYSAYAQQDTQPIPNTQYAYQAQPKPTPQYDMYTGEYIGQNHSNPTEHIYDHVDPEQPKKKSTGRKIAVIAAALVLTLCVGVGGGFLGSYLAGGNSIISTESSADGDASKTSKESSDSVLRITQASDTEIAPTTTQEVAAKVKDAVVEITTETTTYDSFYGQYISQAAGSGVIISEDGYLLTNNHVIDGATSIKVRLTNTKTYDAKVIGKDATLDIALLKIEETGLTTATFGDSAKLSVGQTAIAIGNPLGQLGGTVTDGIISALDREIDIDGKTMNLLQTNAAINPGNSGGGLFDANGNLIGIVVAKSSSTSSGTAVEGLGFAIPVNDIVDVLEDLKTNGRVTGRAYLGVNLVDITTENAMFMYRVDKAGVYVTAVADGSAADKAGIQAYDCITKVDDKEISEASELTAVISKHKAGDTIKLTVYRDGETKTFDVTLGEKQAEEESSDETSVPSSRYGNSGGYYGGDIFGDDYYYGNR